MKTQILKCSELTGEQIKEVARALVRGAIAVFATDTVYGLGTGAFCEQSVQKIYTIKQRPATQPLQLLVADMASAQRVAQFSQGAKRVAQKYWPGGLTLIVPPSPAGKELLRGANGLGLRVPDYQPLQQVLSAMRVPLASTSANLHGQPVLTQEQEVLDTFDGSVDYILLGGTLSPMASSVLDASVTPAKLLRPGSILKTDLQGAFGAPIV